MSSRHLKRKFRQGFDPKVWPATFTKRRGLECNLDKLIIEPNDTQGEFRTFFKDPSVSCLEFRELEEYFQGFNIEHLSRGERGAGTRTAAWVDERSFADGARTGLVRTNGQGELTAQGLWNKLKIPVCSS
jgi:hypothetical protein